MEDLSCAGKRNGRYIIFLYFLAMPYGLWDLSSPTRGLTHTPYSKSMESTTGPPRNSIEGVSVICKIFIKAYTHFPWYIDASAIIVLKILLTRICLCLWILFQRSLGLEGASYITIYNRLNSYVLNDSWTAGRTNIIPISQIRKLSLGEVIYLPPRS